MMILEQSDLLCGLGMDELFDIIFVEMVEDSVCFGDTLWLSDRHSKLGSAAESAKKLI